MHKGSIKRGSCALNVQMCIFSPTSHFQLLLLVKKQTQSVFDIKRQSSLIFTEVSQIPRSVPCWQITHLLKFKHNHLMRNASPAPIPAIPASVMSAPRTPNSGSSSWKNCTNPSCGQQWDKSMVKLLFSVTWFLRSTWIIQKGAIWSQESGNVKRSTIQWRNTVTSKITSGKPLLAW